MSEKGGKPDLAANKSLMALRVFSWLGFFSLFLVRERWLLGDGDTLFSRSEARDRAEMRDFVFVAGPGVKKLC